MLRGGEGAAVAVVVVTTVERPVVTAAFGIGRGEKANEEGEAPSSFGVGEERYDEKVWGGGTGMGRVGEGKDGDGYEGGTPLFATVLLQASSKAVGAGKLEK